MKADEYVRMIMEDELESIVRETPKIYEDMYIVREYEFKDGAVVDYEWRDASAGAFNHRFTLVKAPKVQGEKFSLGEIVTINY